MLVHSCLQTPPVWSRLQQVHPGGSVKARPYAWPAAPRQPVHRSVTPGSRAQVSVPDTADRCGTSARSLPLTPEATCVRSRAETWCRTPPFWTSTWSVSHSSAARKQKKRVRRFHRISHMWSRHLLDSPRNTAMSVSPAGDGLPATLTCSSDANPPVQTYAWYRGEACLPFADKSSHPARRSKGVSAGGGQTISTVTAEEYGEHCCVARNRHGFQTDAVTIRKPRSMFMHKKRLLLNGTVSRQRGWNVLLLEIQLPSALFVIYFWIYNDKPLSVCCSHQPVWLFRKQTGAHRGGRWCSPARRRRGRLFHNKVSWTLDSEFVVQYLTSLVIPLFLQEAEDIETNLVRPHWDERSGTLRGCSERK